MATLGGFDDEPAAGIRLRKGEVDGLLVRRNLDALDLLQLLDAALHLLGFGRLIAEAVDEGFELLDALALVLVRGDQRVAALLFLREIFFVVAAVEVNALVPDLDDAIDGDVEEVAIVRDEDVGEGILEQVLFEPVAGFEIEMVRGLVEQQQVGLRQQQLGERDAHLPAAGELFGVARPVFFAEAETVEHGADLRVERIAVVHAKMAEDNLVAIGHLRVLVGVVIEFRDFVRELFHLLFERAQIGEDRHALVEDGAAGKLQAVLRKVAESRVLGRDDRTVVECLEAAENFQQRGFAGAVSADQADTRVRRDQPIEIFEEEFGSESFAGGGELNHDRCKGLYQGTT